MNPVTSCTTRRRQTDNTDPLSGRFVTRSVKSVDRYPNGATPVVRRVYTTKCVAVIKMTLMDLRKAPGSCKGRQTSGASHKGSQGRSQPHPTYNDFNESPRHEPHRSSHVDATPKDGRESLLGDGGTDIKTRSPSGGFVASFFCHHPRKLSLS
jgi:hypothetical protein